MVFVGVYQVFFNQREIMSFHLQRGMPKKALQLEDIHTRSEG